MAFLTPPTWLETPDEVYNAVDYRTMLGTLLGAGTSGVTTSTALAVSQKSGTANMSVDVAAGGVFVASTRSNAQGTYHAYNDGVVNVVLSAADPTNPRIDRILVQIREEAQDAALTQNDATILVVQGTPAASPVAPTVTVDDFVELAQVTVAAATSAITDANISDTRDVLTPLGTIGTAVDDALGGKAIRSGKATGTVPSGTPGANAVSASFGTTFATAPVVTATVEVGANTDLVVNLQSVSATGFTYRVINKNDTNQASARAYSVHWVAVGTLA